MWWFNSGLSSLLLLGTIVSNLSTCLGQHSIMPFSSFVPLCSNVITGFQGWTGIIYDLHGLRLDFYLNNFIKLYILYKIYKSLSLSQKRKVSSDAYSGTPVHTACILTPLFEMIDRRVWLSIK